MKRTGLGLAVASAMAVLVGCGGEASQQQDVEAAVTEEAPTATSAKAAAKPAMTLVDRISASEAKGEQWQFPTPLDTLAADYVKLALQFGNYDANYVDAYHGPAAWREAAEASENPDTATGLRQMGQATQELIDALDALDLEGTESAFRAVQLRKTLRAMAVRIRVVAGEPVTFDEEVAGIYDIAPPVYDLSDYDPILNEIDALLPGEGTLAARVDAFRYSLAIPSEKLGAVMDRAIDECRSRTAAHYPLPDSESFRLEYVNDKPWGGYNYYQGDFESLIQINTDFPVGIDRAVDLGCHEGYPGHHVWNLFIEDDLVNQREWIEYSVNPLFGPFAPIAEGSANYGIELAFPGDEKLVFERDVLFPLAGLDPALAAKLDALNALTGKLAYARNELARRYLDGALSREEVLPLIQKYSLVNPEKAAQNIRFIETYRAYVINYNIGKATVRQFVEAGDDRWGRFEQVLKGPLSASDIVSQ